MACELECMNNTLGSWKCCDNNLKSMIEMVYDNRYLDTKNYFFY
jgi:hypothetical protein